MGAFAWLVSLFELAFLETYIGGIVLVFWFGLDGLVLRNAQFNYLFSFGILNSIMIFLVMVQNQIWQKRNYPF